MNDVHIFRLRMPPDINLAVDELVLDKRRESRRIGKNEVLLELLTRALREDGILRTRREPKTKTRPVLRLRRATTK
jgi:hypothetical protein